MFKFNEIGKMRPLLVGVAGLVMALSAHAQSVIKIGEVNSYKAQPAFLEPYKKGMELAVEEINADRSAFAQKMGSSLCMVSVRVENASYARDGGYSA